MKTTLFVVLLCLTVASCTQYLADFTAIIAGNIESTSSDCQGRMLVGGNARLTNYGIGTRLAVDCDRFDLQVAGNFVGTSGQISSGKGSVGGTIATQSWGTPCGSLVNAAPEVNVADVISSLTQDSESIASEATTGTTTWNGNSVSFTGSDEYNYFTISSDSLNGMTGMTIDIPRDSWAFITVTGTSATFTNFQVFLGSNTQVRRVLFNLPEVTTLNAQSFTFEGSVLAPLATVNFNYGNVEGSLACLNFNGNGEFHYSPYVPPETDCEVVCPPCDQTITVPSTRFFSLFLQYDLVANSTDFEGRVALGGDATLQSVGIGSKLYPSNGRRDDLIVDGNLVYTDGEVFNGNIVYSGTATLTRVGTPQGTVEDRRIRIPWRIDFIKLHLTSIFLATWFSFGIETVNYSTLNLYGFGYHLNVFKISSTTLANARTIVINVPSSSHVLINVYADTPTVVFSNTGTILNGAHPSRILWNFVDTVTLEMSAVEIQGSILAPVTDVVFNNGQLKGAIFASSYTGNGEIHLATYVPLPVPCEPCQC